MKTVSIAILASLALTALAWGADNFYGDITTVQGVAKCAGPLGQGNYALQNKSASFHAAASSQADGGGSSTIGSTADTKSVLVNATVLYDLDITSNILPYICVMGADGGATTTQLYVHTTKVQ